MAEKKSSNFGFVNVEPQVVLNWVEDLGFKTTGRLQQLNSYENRVFSVELEEPTLGVKGQNLIIKIYRPGRWTEQQIFEEHTFTHELKNQGLLVSAPLVLQQTSLFKKENYFFACFEKVQGRLLDEVLPQQLESLGRSVALLHNIGAQKKFQHRLWQGQADHSLWAALETLESFVAPEMWNRYEQAVITIADQVDQIPSGQMIRLHGDLHRGNLLCSDKNPSESTFILVDFDDCGQGLPIQDFWMLFSDPYSEEDRATFLKGYLQLRDFDSHQWAYLPWIQGLRIVNYAAWIAKRWHDPVFPHIFPQFRDYTYWASETEALEKIAWHSPSVLRH